MKKEYEVKAVCGREVIAAPVQIEGKLVIPNFSSVHREQVKIFGEEYVSDRFAAYHVAHVSMGDFRREVNKQFLMRASGLKELPERKKGEWPADFTALVAKGAESASKALAGITLEIPWMLPERGPTQAEERWATDVLADKDRLAEAVAFAGIKKLKLANPSAPTHVELCELKRLIDRG